MLMKETFSAAKVVGTVAHASQTVRSINALFTISFEALSTHRQFKLLSSSGRCRIDAQVCDFWFHDLLVITITYLNSIGVRSGFEHDVVLLRQVIVHVRAQIIEVPKRRHCADSTVGK